MDEREVKLPLWAQKLITNLRARLQSQNEPLVRELATLRPKVQLLKAENEVMKELLVCAARGGHKTAQEIVSIIQCYDLQLIKKEDT